MPSTFSFSEAPTQRAEWLPAQCVLLSRPGTETLLGLLQHLSHNFPFPFPLKAGQAEHDAYRRALEANGVRVIDVREALAAAPPDKLRAWARAAVALEPEGGMSAEEAAACDDQLARALAALDPEHLAELILLRPGLRVGVNPNAVDPTTRFSTRFELRPAISAYYTRDPLMTTARGCVVTRLHLDIRQPENEIAAHVLEALGIEPLLRIAAPGTVEGGDFIPCGDFVLQGQGLLTNAEGVRQCLEAGVYGPVEVGVVVDPRGNMDEMHLDTY